MRADSMPCRPSHVLIQFSWQSLAAYSEICLFSEAMRLGSFVFLLCCFHLRVSECRAAHMCASLASTNGVFAVVATVSVNLSSAAFCSLAHSAYGLPLLSSASAEDSAASAPHLRMRSQSVILAVPISALNLGPLIVTLRMSWSDPRLTSSLRQVASRVPASHERSGTVSRFVPVPFGSLPQAR